MIKDIVIALQLGAAKDTALDYALSVASAFDAHITAIGFAYDPIMMAIEMGSDVPVDVMDEERARNKKVATDALAAFEEKVRVAGLASESRVVEASLSGAPEMLGSLARAFDLCVVGQANPEALDDNAMAEGALFDSGRPVLVVPYIQRTGVKLDRVTVCWDGTRNATRAVHDAMPFLVKAKAVDVVTMTGEPSKATTLKNVDIAQHLARHGVRAELRQIPIGNEDLANIVLSDAADRGTDFIVMGGYGHSRLREFVLGGMTRGILSSMTVPVLLSH